MKPISPVPRAARRPPSFGQTATLAAALVAAMAQPSRPLMAQPPSQPATQSATEPATAPAVAAASAPVLAPGVPAIFRDADLALGQRLLAQQRCSECHARRVGGDGSAIYRPQGRLQTAGLLRGMVEYCNTELGLGLFPEEVTAMAAVLNRDHYRFER